jgi:hypothetical protein
MDVVESAERANEVVVAGSATKEGGPTLPCTEVKLFVGNRDGNR